MKLPYYSMWAADFEMDVRVLTMSWAARGLYNCLLNRSWLNDGLPYDPEMVRRLSGADREVRILPAVVSSGCPEKTVIEISEAGK